MSKIVLVKNAKGVHLEINGNAIEEVTRMNEYGKDGHKYLEVRLLADDITWRFENESCE